MSDQDSKPAETREPRRLTQTKNEGTRDNTPPRDESLWQLTKFDAGEPVSVPPPGVLEALERMTRDPLILLCGRVNPFEALRDIAARIQRRWTCCLDSGEQQGGFLKYTALEEIDSAITATDASQAQADRSTPALLVARLFYGEYQDRDNWKNLFSKRREAMTTILTARNCVLLVAIDVEDEFVEPLAKLPALKDFVELDWPETLVRCFDRVVCDKDTVSHFAAIINEYRNEEDYAFLDGRFCAEIRKMLSDRSIREGGINAKDLAIQFAGRLKSVVDARNATRAGDVHQLESPDDYDVRNVINETLVITARFARWKPNRRAFDRLVAVLLPDESVPDDLVPEWHRPRPNTVPPTGSASATWGGLYWQAGPAPEVPKPIKIVTWRELWAEHADSYRAKLGITVNDDLLIKLDHRWLGHVSVEVLLKGRQARVERFTRRVLEQGLIFRDAPLGDEATQLLGHLLAGTGMALNPIELRSVLEQATNQGLDLASPGTTGAVVARVHELFNCIFGILGAEFTTVIAGGLRDYVGRHIGDAVRCQIIAALCLKTRRPLPSWHGEQSLADIVRHILNQGAESVRNAVETQLLDELGRLAARDPEVRLGLISAVRSWLPDAASPHAFTPLEKVALRIVDEGLNRDIAWATDKTYEKRTAAGTLADIAFTTNAKDIARREELVRALAAFRLDHVALLGEPEQGRRWSLADRFHDIFFMTWHGFQPDDAKLMISNCDQFASVFAATAIWDKPASAEAILELFVQEIKISDEGPSAQTLQAEIKFGQFSFEQLPVFFCFCLDSADKTSNAGRMAQEYLNRLDLFHAALIGEWFFLKFHLKDKILSDAEFEEVEAFADMVCKLDCTGRDRTELGKRLPPAFRRLVHIIDAYGPLLNRIAVSRATARAYSLKAKKLKGLAKLFSA